MDFNQFRDWALMGLIGGGVFVLWQMKESMSSLNTKIEMLVGNQSEARKDIDDHETRLRHVERSI